MMIKTILSTALAFSAANTVGAQLRDDIQFTMNSAKLPFKVSDITANYMQGENGDEDGYIIITGGCNSTKGNERITIGGDDLFACLDTSDKTLKFDPFTNTFTELAPALHPRQRHAAAVMDGELYVFGGRDSEDNLVAEIDSFNPKTNIWTSRGKLPEDVVTSDLTAWAWKNYIYITGGFVANYTAVGSTYRLDMSDKPTTFEGMQSKSLSTSPNARGDFHAVEHYGYAYLAGGITHTSLWCEALKITERYHMETDTWETLADLNSGRADMAVAVLNGKIVAMGGETKPDDCAELSDPAYGSFPADHVDVLLDPAAGKNAKWIEFEELPDERFRFAATVVPALSKIYTFGGQLPFDFTCDCFPTSDDVGVGTEVLEPEQGLSAGVIAAIVLGSVIGVAVAICIIRQCRRRKESKETDAKPSKDFVNTEDAIGV